MKCTEAFSEMVSKISFRTGREANDVCFIEMIEDPANVFIRRRVREAVEAGLISFPRETGDGRLDIGCRLLDFTNHDGARKITLRGVGAKIVASTPGLDIAVDAFDNSAAQQVPGKPIAGRKDYDPLSGEVSQGVKRDPDVGRLGRGRDTLRNHC
jgi:hypothetical protein